MLLPGLTISISLLSGLCSTQRVDWKNVNYLKEAIPARVNQSIASVEIKLATIAAGGYNVFYREAWPLFTSGQSRKTLFLLHGERRSSAVWEDRTEAETEVVPRSSRLQTMQIFAAAGYKVIAVDLPGSGTTHRISGTDSRFPSFSDGQILHDIVRALSPRNPVVVVAPAESGIMIMPLIVSEPDLFCGFVALDPQTASSSAYVGRYKDLRLPTLIIVGALEAMENSEALADNIPTSSRIHIFPPLSRENRHIFHRMLYNFMKLVSC